MPAVRWTEHFDKKIWGSFHAAFGRMSLALGQEDDDIWLHRISSLKKDIERSRSPAATMHHDQRNERGDEVRDHGRMRPRRSGHLVELSLDNLVASAIVGERKEILVAPGTRGFRLCHIASLPESSAVYRDKGITRRSPPLVSFRPRAPTEHRSATRKPLRKTSLASKLRVWITPRQIRASRMKPASARRAPGTCGSTRAGT